MNVRTIQFKLILVALLLSCNAPAVTSNTGSGSYAIIVERNPFGLKPPVIEVPPPPPPPPPTNLELTGITTLFGKKQVFFNVKEQKGTTSAKVLTFGEVIDGIEVLAINETEGEVRMRNRGIETLLTFAKNAAKIPSGPPPTATAPAVMQRFQPPVANPAVVPQGNDVGLGGLGGIGEVAIPTRSIRTAPIPVHLQVQPPPQQQLSPEAQILMMEINRSLDQGGPPLPPTPLTPPTPQ